MTSYVPVRKNDANGAIFYIALSPQTATGAFQANPTLAAGDFKISKDGGAFANLGTLPDVDPDSGKAVKVTLSQTETNADNIQIIGSDAAGAEWCDIFINIQTTARNIDDLAWPTTTGRSIDVTTTGEVGLDWANIGSPTTTVGLSGTTVKTATDVETDTQDIQARLPAALVSGRIDASVGAMASGVVTATAVADGAIDRATFAADTGLQTTRSNTAQAGAAGTITLDASASAVDDFYKGELIYLTGGTGVGQVRICTAYVGSTKVATITPNWATNPDNTSTFAVLPDGPADLKAISGAVVSTSSAQLGTNVVNAAGTAWNSGAIGAATLAADSITAAKVADGTIDAATFAASAITATAIAADAITAAKIANGAIDAATFAAGTFTFSVAGQVDANVTYVNDVEVDGVGSTLDPWGPV